MSSIDKEKLKTICKVGQGDECCRYITCGASGFECVKHKPLGSFIDNRVKDETMTAIGDNCSSAESMLEMLKEKVNLRNQMGGALYYNILNDECCQLASKCLRMGCSSAAIDEILGPGTFTR